MQSERIRPYALRCGPRRASTILPAKLFSGTGRFRYLNDMISEQRLFRTSALRAAQAGRLMHR